MADIHVTGLKELQAFLDQLPAKLERNVMRGALRAGATKELLPEVQANLLSEGAVKTGELIAGLKVKTGARGGKVTASVIATGPHAYIGKWIEYGVKAHKIAVKTGWLFFGGIFAKVVQHPGLRPRPFMRPALDRAGSAAVVAAANYMKERLEAKNGLDTADIQVGDQV